MRAPDGRRTVPGGPLRLRPRPAPVVAAAGQGRGWQWVLALLPAFPLFLLVLRLWLLSRQDLAVMLLLVQHINPLGLASALVITLAWVPPVIVLTARVLGLLQVVSRPRDAESSWLAGRVNRTPDWVITIFVVWASITWQLKYLPTLLLLTVAITGLTIRHRYGDQRGLVRAVCVWLPIAAAVAAYAWLAPGLAAAQRDGDVATLLLLAAPPALAGLLTGPIPRSMARVVTQWFAATAAFVAPFLIGAIFLRTPVLPPVALEVEGPSGVEVVRSNIVAVDDRMTTLLDPRGHTEFVLNDRIRSKTLCPSTEQIPLSLVEVRGWSVDRTALELLSPPPAPPPDDPRCQGRPLP